VDLDTGFLVLRLFTGLAIAAHGAQKAYGWANGPGPDAWEVNVQKMDMRPHWLWARAAAWGELAGGICLALGLLTGIAAGVLVMDMIVAIWKVHWAKGFWVHQGGMEYALTDLVVFGVVGLAGPGMWAVDRAIGLASWSAALFVATLVIGLVSMWSGTRPAAIPVYDRERMERMEEERRRRHVA
jgi:putative oxidoreductase